MKIYSEMDRIAEPAAVHGFQSLCMHAFVIILVKEDRHSPATQPKPLSSKTWLFGFFLSYSELPVCFHCHFPTGGYINLRQMHRARSFVLQLYVWNILWSLEGCAKFSQVLRAIWKCFAIILAISLYLFLPALIRVTHLEIDTLRILKRHTCLSRHLSKSLKFASQY